MLKEADGPLAHIPFIIRWGLKRKHKGNQVASIKIAMLMHTRLFIKERARLDVFIFLFYLLQIAGDDWDKLSVEQISFLNYLPISWFQAS